MWGFNILWHSFVEFFIALVTHLWSSALFFSYFVLYLLSLSLYLSISISMFLYATCRSWEREGQVPFFPLALNSQHSTLDLSLSLTTFHFMEFTHKVFFPYCPSAVIGPLHYYIGCSWLVFLFYTMSHRCIFRLFVFHPKPFLSNFYYVAVRMLHKTMYRIPCFFYIFSTFLLLLLFFILL